MYVSSGLVTKTNEHAKKPKKELQYKVQSLQTKCRKNQAESSNFSLVSHGIDTSGFFPWHMNCLLLIIAALDLHEIMN